MPVLGWGGKKKVPKARAYYLLPECSAFSFGKGEDKVDTGSSTTLLPSVTACITRNGRRCDSHAAVRCIYT